MEIAVTDLLAIDNPSEYKMHAARWNGENQPLNVFVDDSSKWRGWNTWRGSKDEFTRKYIFSLIDYYHEADTWLFGGIFEVLKRNPVANSHSYEIIEVHKYQKYVGRLKIKLPKPSRGRAFYLEQHLSKMVVSEILKEVYSGAKFPGYENICHDHCDLFPIFKNEKPDWKSALQNVKGVYLIMDKNNGKKYVGSAYGDSGIWSRWNCYMNTGHGYNDELYSIIEQNGMQYAKDNFRFSLLEHRSMRSEDSYIIQREGYWKEILISRGEFGYNKN